jgi:tyrosine decarboxylase / aspartate 1-decarboxylase
MWRKLAEEEIKTRIFNALEDTVNYYEESVLGVPASHLDSKVFYQGASFLKEAPYISTLVRNPNHIGCHTLGKSESFFRGTQEIEKELIEICAVDILKAQPNSIDGYVASGGTEANMQAIWIYRNFFQQEFSAKNEQIGIVCSQDSHYSMDKAANVLNIQIEKVAVDSNERTISEEAIQHAIELLEQRGVTHFIVVANMMTTMFGSVDSIDLYTETLGQLGVSYKLHVDGAYGGFYYPFTKKDSQLTFLNPNVSSVTLDAHKMLQAPYGTGIFLCRKGLIHYANTKQASYVEGEDYTLIGSRSGANAVAIWMILSTYGPFGWLEKILTLQNRTEWMCGELKRLNIEYYRNAYCNIITIKAPFVSHDIAHKYGLVPDNHQDSNWYKIVIMEHVTTESLLPLVKDLEVLKLEI